MCIQYWYWRPFVFLWMEYSEGYDPSRGNTSGGSGRYSYFYNNLLRIKDKICQLYYKHGLLCSSNPWIVICCSLLIFLFACYPILGNHLSHHSYSHRHVTDVHNFWDPFNTSSSASSSSSSASFSSFTSKSSAFFVSSLKEPPKWVSWVAFSLTG